MPDMIIWRNKDLNDLRTELNARNAGGRQVLTEVLTDIADEAVEKMVHTIETIPSGLVPGKIGRVDTGLMRDSVKRSEVTSASRKTSVKVGWTDTKERYFLFQEQGADNAFGAATGQGGVRRIPPMHALLGAFIWAREELRQRIEHLVNS